MASDNFSYEQDGSFESDVCRIVEKGLQDHQQDKLSRQTIPLNIAVKENGQIIGGILGVIVAKRLNVAALWVAPHRRRTGIGRNLLLRLENAAQQAGCDHALVDTMIFQAPDFYIQSGYAEIARLTNVYDHARIFLRKELS